MNVLRASRSKTAMATQGDSLLILTTKNAPHFKIIRTSLSDPNADVLYYDGLEAKLYQRISLPVQGLDDSFLSLPLR